MRKTSSAMPVQTAVILAAGIGQRLGALADGQPKGALRLGARSIVEESIAKLRTAGVTRILIGTGYGAHYYRDLAAEACDIELCHNRMYSQSGSMYTLAELGQHVDEDFLLLESDLVYEARALQVLQSADSGSTMLVSGFTGAGDEVFVEANASGRLLTLSKHRRELGADVIGELVGISRLSVETVRDMIERRAHCA